MTTAERFRVRTKTVVNTYLFSILRAVQHLLIMTRHQIINTAYRVHIDAIQRTIFIQAQKDFIAQYGSLDFRQLSKQVIFLCVTPVKLSQ